MKKDFLFSKREGLALAMKQLLHYNVWTAICLDESFFEEKALLKYFEADFDDPIEEEYENIIAAAITRTVYEKDYIPKVLKKVFAKKSVRQQLDSLRAAKITYQEEVKGISQREAFNLRRENQMVRRIAIIDNTVKCGIRGGTKAGISAAIGWLVTVLAPEVTIPAWIIGGCAYAIISILPDKIKEPILKKAKQSVDTIIVKAKHMADLLSKRAVAIAQSAKKSLEKLGERAKQLWEDTRVVAQESWERVSTGSKKVKILSNNSN